MAVPDPAVDAYLAQVTGPRAGAVRRLRELCLEHLDGFTEGMKYGKGCVRYRRAEQLDEDVVRSILQMTASTTGPIC